MLLEAVAVQAAQNCDEGGSQGAELSTLVTSSNSATVVEVSLRSS